MKFPKHLNLNHVAPFSAGASALVGLVLSSPLASIAKVVSVVPLTAGVG